MSLTLATADTITGVAGAATSITYTIFGDEVSGGADAFKVLAQGQLPSSVGTLYTAPASTMTIVKAIHLVNGTGGSVTARINVKGTAAANAILPAITILAGGFAIYADDGWRVYNDQGQLLSVGATGATGAGYGGTSVTSLTIGTGSKVFTTQAGLAYVVGSRVRAASAADPADYMEGLVTAYSGTSLTVLVDLIGGTGTDADWSLSIAGEPGATGAGSVASDSIWDAKGDLAGGTGANTAARLPVGANGSYLRAASGQSTGLEWQLNNLAAAVAPTVNEDSGDGYSIGSRWLNTSTDKEYVCLDATVGAAVWVETTGGGSAVYPFTLGDQPPASPDARNEEWNSTTPVNTWTNVTNSGTPTNAALAATRFDTVVAEPTWNANTDIPGALVMQCKQSSFFKRYMAFAPTPGTRWAVMAKIRTGFLDAGTEDLVGLQLYKETPGSTNWNPTDGLVLRFNLFTGPYRVEACSYQAGTEARTAIEWGEPMAYVAFTGLTNDTIAAWASSDGIAWRLIQSFASFNINANVNFLALIAFDVTATFLSPLAVCEFIRFLAGSSNLNALVAGN